jgi:hypothetical protein
MSQVVVGDVLGSSSAGWMDVDQPRGLGNGLDDRNQWAFDVLARPSGFLSEG